MVALSRGVGVDRDPIDPFATALLPRRVAALVKTALRPDWKGSVARSVYRAVSLGLVDHIALRTLAIDRYLSETVAAGVDQVVILGAGLDARAWRLPKLADLRVFEIDHPATQGYKCDRIRALPPNDRVEFVPVDFLRERFVAKLSDSGFDATRPALWIWEGVTMYLTNAAIEDSVQQITSISAPGSCVLMSYVVSDSLPFGRLGAALTRGLFKLGGEPLGAGMAPDEVSALLGASWQVVHNDGPAGWKAFTGANARASTIFAAERLAVAVRQAK